MFIQLVLGGFHSHGPNKYMQISFFPPWSRRDNGGAWGAEGRRRRRRELLFVGIGSFCQLCAADAGDAWTIWIRGGVEMHPSSVCCCFCITTGRGGASCSHVSRCSCRDLLFRQLRRAWIPASRVRDFILTLASKRSTGTREGRQRR